MESAVAVATGQPEAGAAAAATIPPQPSWARKRRGGRPTLHLGPKYAPTDPKICQNALGLADRALPRARRWGSSRCSPNLLIV